MKCMHCGGPVGHDGKYAEGGMVESNEMPSDEYEMEYSGPKEYEENEIEEYPESDQKQASDAMKNMAFAAAMRSRNSWDDGASVRNDGPEDEGPISVEDELHRKKRERYSFGKRG